MICRAMEKPERCMIGGCFCAAQFEVRLAVWVCAHHNLTAIPEEFMKPSGKK